MNTPIALLAVLAVGLVGSTSPNIAHAATAESPLPDPDGPITLPGDNGPVATLADIPLEPGVAVSESVTSFESTTGGVELEVHTLGLDAIRAQTIIQAPTDPHEFAYSFSEGYTPIEAQDGSFWLVGFSTSGTFNAYSIEPAWALDADGTAVATHYEVRGAELVQVVEPTGDAEYPIVADPTWQWYSAAYGAGFSKAETRSLAAWGAVTGFCAALPGPFGVGCAVAGAQWFLQAQLAANEGECVFIATVPAPLAMRWISPECQ